MPGSTRPTGKSILYSPHSCSTTLTALVVTPCTAILAPSTMPETPHSEPYKPIWSNPQIRNTSLELDRRLIHHKKENPSSLSQELVELVELVKRLGFGGEEAWLGLQSGVSYGEDCCTALVFGTVASGGDFNRVCARGESHSGDTEGVNLRAKGLILAKVYALLIVFFATFLAGISPYFFRWNEAFLVLGTQFAGGVFLATAMIHFLGDSHDVFRKLRPSSYYAYSEMLAVVGYLLTMLADVAIQRVNRRQEYQPDAKLPRDVENSPDVAGRKAGIMSTTNFGDALLLILALCFHSIFEGIAIGVAATKGNTWKALWTVTLHKVFAAVAMGIALLRMLPNRPLLQCVLYAFAFAISTPIGVAIGIIINSTTEGRTADWIYAFSMGIATGVFIYVAINHLLAKGYKPVNEVALNRPVWRWLAAVLGAALIAIVLIWG